MSTSNLAPLSIYQASTDKGDAFMAFHLKNRHACYLGISTTTEDLFWGGWSDGAVKNRVWHEGNMGSGSGLDADKLRGAAPDTAITASTIVKRTSNKDVQARLFRCDFANGTTISGAMAFRINNGSDNYIRFCSSKSAIRTWLDVDQSGSGTATNATNATNARIDHDTGNAWHCQSLSIPVSLIMPTYV